MPPDRPPLDVTPLPPNLNHLWARLLVDELVRQGVGLFVVCPGSRSTPLAVAVAHAESRGDIEVVVHWDERAAAFVALGWGRATGRPAAVVTTSGTAVANLLPAAVEADADGVPLLLLTADRPPELRETGANQTIRQPPIFQDIARWMLDAPVPSIDVPARWLFSTAACAVQQTCTTPGPVHLNLPFREPLGTQPDGLDLGAYLDGIVWADEAFHGAEGGRPGGATAVGTFAADRRGPTIGLPWVERLSGIEKGLVVLGPDAPAAAADRFAAALGWPLVADIRADVGAKSAVPFVDMTLASERARAMLAPQAVVHVGGRLVSKRLGQLLREAAPAPYIHLTDRPARIDPDSLHTDRVLADPGWTLEAWAGAVSPTPSRAWRDAWRTATAAVSSSVGPSLSEPAIARRVAAAEVAALVVAASMPIRDVLTYGNRPRARVIANRGASGIDGTIATAHGVARSTGGPVVVLTGDLTLLHDQTSLALLRDGPPVVVVVINNDGGGIFHRLPIADGLGALDEAVFERMFGTPHGLGFEAAARQVGLAYHAPTTLGAFEADLDAALRSGASAILEVRTDRDEQAALRRRLEAEAAAAVDAALADLDGA